MASTDFEIHEGRLTKHLGDGGDVVIPGGVTEIGEGAFAKCEVLFWVRIADSALVRFGSISEVASPFAGTPALPALAERH